MARKKPVEPPSWQLTNIGLLMFTSLMIILLAFFIMLSSLSVVDERREKNALGSVLGAFGILPSGLSAIGSDSANLSPSSSPVQKIQADLEQMKEILTQEIVEDKIDILKGKARRIISFQDALLFEPDSVEILEEMKPVLLKLAEVLKNSDYPIIIKGHTDDQPPRNEALINNWYVSASRAANLLRFFVDQGGLDAYRMSAFGYAGYRPMVVNKNPESRTKNRRIELILDTTHKVALQRYKKETWKPKPLKFKGFYFDLFGKGQSPK